MDNHRVFCFTRAVDAALKYVLRYGVPAQDIKLRNMQRFLNDQTNSFNFKNIADAPVAAHMCIKSCWDAIFALLREADSFELEPLSHARPQPEHADIHLVFDNVLYVIEVKATFKANIDTRALSNLRLKARKQINSSLRHLPEQGRGYQSLDAFALYFILSESQPATMIWEKPHITQDLRFHLKQRVVK